MLDYESDKPFNSNIKLTFSLFSIMSDYESDKDLQKRNMGA